MVRDIALAASGLLNPKVGGPSVFPPLPAFLFQPPASYGPKIWPEETGPDRYRRALYTFRFRSVPYPMLQTFDAPNGDFACVRRSRSNTPLQALMTLNEPVFLECARALALRTLADGGRPTTTASSTPSAAAWPAADGRGVGTLRAVEEGRRTFRRPGRETVGAGGERPGPSAALPAGATPPGGGVDRRLARVAESG